MSQQPLPARRADFLDRKLIFIKRPLRDHTEKNTTVSVASTDAENFQTPPSSPSVSPRTPIADAAELPVTGSMWAEPNETPRRPRATFQQDFASPSSPSILSPPESQELNSTNAANRALTHPRHTPLTSTRAKQPQVPPHDARIAGYLGAGGSRVLKPLKHDVRIQRNRVIFVSVLCAVFLIILWAIFVR